MPRLFLYISSRWVKIKLHTNHQLPSLLRTALNVTVRFKLNPTVFVPHIYLDGFNIRFLKSSSCIACKFVYHDTPKLC